MAESSAIPLSPSIRSSTTCGAIPRIWRAILFGRPTRPRKSTSQRTRVGKEKSRGCSLNMKILLHYTLKTSPSRTLGGDFPLCSTCGNMPSEARRMTGEVRTGVNPLSCHDAQGMPQPGNEIDEQQELNGQKKIDFKQFLSKHYNKILISRGYAGQMIGETRRRTW